MSMQIIGGMRIYPNDTSQEPVDQPTTPSSISSITVPASSSDGQLDAAYADLTREDGSMLWTRITPINGLRTGYDFTYDFNKQVVYWLEHNQTAGAFDIMRVNFDGEGRERLSSNAAATSAFCLEFDEASRNLFVGNSFESQIDVVNVETMQRAVVLAGNVDETGVGFPVEIAVNAADAELYWVDWGLGVVPQKIGACKMDGSESRVIVRNNINRLTGKYLLLN
jgi:hypothetical protein